MKKIIFSFIIILFSINTFACDRLDLLGEWMHIENNDTVIWTFKCDSVFIDEIGNEGFQYSYHVKGDSIIYQDTFDEYYNIKNIVYIVYLDKRYLGMMFNNDITNTVYMFERKDIKEDK